MIRQVCEADIPHICQIYNHYVGHTATSFEVEPVSVEEMTMRVNKVKDRGYPWLVFCEKDHPVAYAYISEWKTRAAYNQSVESSIYCHKDHTGKGIGEALYGQLIGLAKELGLHCVIGGVVRPNPASAHLHEKMGFRYVGVFEQVGYKMGAFQSVEYWSLILDPK